jgi:hypothetical protein
MAMALGSLERWDESLKKWEELYTLDPRFLRTIHQALSTIRKSNGKLDKHKPTWLSRDHTSSSFSLLHSPSLPSASHSILSTSSAPISSGDGDATNSDSFFGYKGHQKRSISAIYIPAANNKQVFA